MTNFSIQSNFKISQAQQAAVGNILKSFNERNKHHVLLGVTGSGKTFTMAQVIAAYNRSTLVIAPNKTLAAQLFTSLREFFPKNHVGFFISYYDYYQPEAYVPSTDTYIAKDSSINDNIDKMRHESTRNLFEQPATIIVSSVSCIYGLGSPQAYANLVVHLKRGQEMDRDSLLKGLINVQYSRNDYQLQRGCFRVRGDVIDICSSHQVDEAVRVELFGDEIEALAVINSLTGKTVRTIDKVSIYPNSHYVADRSDIQGIVKEVLTDLGDRLREFKKDNKLLECQRLEQRTMQDIEAFEQLGFCPGIENYSRYLTGKKPGQPPPTLLDYFPEGFLTIVDESHITVPQIGGMYRGDRARKETLVNYGFRLPSALDNRPLSFEEFLQKTDCVLHVSATPSPQDLKLAGGEVSEQLVRPTGIIDPPIIVKKATNQVDDLLGEIREVTDRGERVLITTLTKKMAEDLSQFYQEAGVNIRYLHSDIDSIERTELLRGLRMGKFDVLIGINLLREGLDLPEVSLVAIMDADKEGFLRSRTSLIQTVGRAARNPNARVLFFADRITGSMREAMEETERRRKVQREYNEAHGITPKMVDAKLPQDLKVIYGIAEEIKPEFDKTFDKLKEKGVHSQKDLEKYLRRRTKEMHKAAGLLDFEKAAQLRDEIKELTGVSLL